MINNTMDKVLEKFKGLSLKDKKRFMQCFNCRNLNNCTYEEESEDEYGMCRHYKKLRYSGRKHRSFEKILTEELDKEVNKNG